MAQMTVAVALGSKKRRTTGNIIWRIRLAAGRGLCDANLAALVCEQGSRLPFGNWMNGASAGRASPMASIRQTQRAGARSGALRLCRFPLDGPCRGQDIARTRCCAKDNITRIGDLYIADLIGRPAKA